MSPSSDEWQWHLDKRVIGGVLGCCFSLLVGFFVQTVYLTQYFTTKFDTYDSRLAALEKSDDDQQTHEKRITVLEQQWTYIRDDLAEIKALLRREIPSKP